MAQSELSQEDIDALLSRAAERARTAAGAGTGAVAVPATTGGATRAAASTIGTGGLLDDLLDVPLEVRVRLGQAVLAIEEIAALHEGAVVELDRASGEPMDILVNDRLIARGEVVVVDDRFGVRITEILAPDARAGRE